MSTVRLCLIAAAVTLIVPATLRAQEVRLGYVDIQSAIRQVDDGQRAMRQLETELEQRQSVLDEQERALRELTERLDQDIVTMDAERRQQEMAAFQAQVAAYQQAYEENQRALLAMEQEATREIVDRMVEIVGQIARERELTMVFERTRSALVWADEGLDLTDELIRRYEAAE